MFGNFNMSNIMENAKEMQKELEKIEVTGESGAGAVKITINAKHYIKRLEISDETFNDGKEITEDLVMAAFNDAVSKVEQVTQSKMMDMSSLLGSFMGGNENKDDDK